MDDDLNTQLRAIATSLERKCEELGREHPITARMLSAAFERVIEFIRLYDSDEMSQEIRNARGETLCRDINELMGWLGDSRLRPTSEELSKDIDAWTTAYVRAGGKQAAFFVQNTYDIWTRKAKGRPAEAEIRSAAIRGLEMKLSNPKLSWKKIAADVWPVDRSIDSPEQCLRQQVMALRKVLKSFGLPGSAPFERYPRESRSWPVTIQEPQATVKKPS